MAQLREQDIATIKELINGKSELILEKIQSLDTKIELVNDNLETKIQSLDTKIELVNDSLSTNIQAVSGQISMLEDRVKRVEGNSDKVSTAIIVAVLSVVIAGLIKWVLPTADLLS